MVGTLKSIGTPEALKAVEEFQKSLIQVLLKDPDAETRASAAEALGQIGEGVVDALPSLTQALQDQNEFVRASASGALRSIGAKFGGVGIRMAVENQDLRIIELIPKSPAFEANIQAGDFILKIDGVEVNISKESGKVLRDYEKNLRGKIGTSVTLTIQRGEGENQKFFDVAITRKEITTRKSIIPSRY